MFLFAVAVEAQSLPDVARQERERRAALKPVFVLTPENLKESATPSSTAAPAETESKTPAEAARPDDSKPAPAAAPSAQAKPADEAAKKEEAAKKYQELLSRLRAKIVLLQDQETAIQLQINDVKNQFLAPVSDSASQAQAQARLDQAQIHLTATQRDLSDTRRELQVAEAQGPPKP